MKEIIKDFTISLLIIGIIGLILAVLYYDDISIRKVIPESEEYFLSPEMKKDLEETKPDDAKEKVINYYIDADDLKKYENNKEYIKGKSNPFAESSSIENNNQENISINNNNQSSTLTNNSTSGNFYEDDGTK